MSCSDCGESHRGRHCSNCGELHSNSIVFCDKCKNSKSGISLSPVRWLAFLKRMRGLISSGRKLAAVDSDDQGNKETYLSWGGCDETKEGWPDKEDHLWPYQFESQGRVAPRYRGKDMMCPFDRRRDQAPEDRGLSGCFYTCDYFSPEMVRVKNNPRKKRPGPRLTDRTEVLRRYDEEISNLETT